MSPRNIVFGVILSNLSPEKLFSYIVGLMLSGHFLLDHHFLDQQFLNGMFRKGNDVELSFGNKIFNMRIIGK